MNGLSIAYIKDKWNHSGFQKYLRNTGWMFLGRIFILGISFLVNAYVAKYLGPSNFGQFSYVISFVGLFSFIASFGIDSIVSREILNGRDKDKTVGTAVYMKIIGSIVAIVIISIVAYMSTADSVIFAMIVFFSFTYLFQASNIIDIYFQTQVQSKYPVINSIAIGIISSVLKIALVIYGAGIIWLIVIYVIESLLTALGLIYFYLKKKNRILKWKFDPTMAKSILSDAWPLMLSSVAISIYMKIDQVMINHMLGNIETGIYAVAVKLSEVWYFIPSIICASIFPALVNAKKINGEIYTNRMRKLYFSMFWTSALIAIGISLFANPIVHTLFGNQYMKAVTTMHIYVWAGIAVSLGLAINQWLIIENLTRISALTTVFGAVSNIVLNILLIPILGINGAAIATVFSYTLSTIAIIFFKQSKSHLGLVLRSIFSHTK